MQQLMTEIGLMLEGKEITDGPVDITPKKRYVPKTKINIGYIVCGIAFNESGEVLMPQEAKPSCYGKWYLPAGRLEPAESLIEGVKREVKEETGLEYEPLSLIDILSVAGTYHRFTFIGKVTGGQLKTTAEADEESLQAAWVPLDKVCSRDHQYPLRGRDIIPLIQLAKEHHDGKIDHAPVLPVLKPHKCITLRLLLVTITEDIMEVLVGIKPDVHFPRAEVSENYSFLNALIEDAFGKMKERMYLYGVLSVEYDGQPRHVHDGACVSLLMLLPNKHTATIKRIDKYTWIQITDPELQHKIRNRLTPTANVKYTCS